MRLHLDEVRGGDAFGLVNSRSRSDDTRPHSHRLAADDIMMWEFVGAKALAIVSVKP